MFKSLHFFLFIMVFVDSLKKRGLLEKQIDYVFQIKGRIDNMDIVNTYYDLGCSLKALTMRFDVYEMCVQWNDANLDLKFFQNRFDAIVSMLMYGWESDDSCIGKFEGLLKDSFDKYIFKVADDLKK